jgi:hypothetical protein
MIDIVLKNDESNSRLSIAVSRVSMIDVVLKNDESNSRLSIAVSVVNSSEKSESCTAVFDLVCISEICDSSFGL